MVAAVAQASGLGIDLGLVIKVLTRADRVAVQISTDRHWFPAWGLYLYQVECTLPGLYSNKIRICLYDRTWRHFRAWWTFNRVPYEQSAAAQ
jgi:hypothetical protein